MLTSNKEIEQFYKGVDLFNEGKFQDAHTMWEHLWKSIGRKDRRIPLKIFLQLTGAHANCMAEKWDAVRYLWDLVLVRIVEFKEILSEWVQVDDLISILFKYKGKDITLKVFDEVKIDKKWGRLHNDLGTR